MKPILNKSSNWPLPKQGQRYFVPLDIQKALAQSDFSKDFYISGLGYYPQAKNHSMFRDKPDDHLLIYCSAGKGLLRINQGEFDIKPGDLLLLPKDEAHYYAADQKDPWSIYWCHFDDDAETLLDSFLAPGTRVIPIGQHRELLDLFQECLQEAQHLRNENTAHYLSSRMRSLFPLINILSTRPAFHANSNLDIEKLHYFFTLKLEQDLTLEQVAREFNLSKFHFVRSYKAATGQTPMRYYQELKIKKACELLDSTALNIEHIAEKLSFKDPDYFSRSFKKHMGISASQYRKHRQV